MKIQIAITSTKVFNCSYCGEKILEDPFYLIQEGDKVEIRHEECLKENLK